jgi:hypothetical protein
MKRNIYFIILFSLFSIGFVHAQEDSTNCQWSINSDFVSRYVWRGTSFSTTPSIQPCIEFSKGGLSIGTWGAYSFHGLDGAETDVYLSYSFLQDKISITVTDYFFPDETIAKNNYFEYDKDKSSHVFEASLSWNGTEEFPLSFLIATNFYGADSKKINNDVNSADFNQEEGIMYSTYLELNYSFSLKNETNLDVFTGFTPTKIRKANPTNGYIGESGFYGDTWGFVNIGMTASKEIKITDDFSLAAFSSLIINPMAENIFLVFGLQL